MKTHLNKGFTLVELMVVVAIIGLLSAVAVPNFKKYQAKAKTSEAKLQLSAVYMSMQSFNLDYNNYGTCLNQMGYDPAREVRSRYYTVGFAAANDAANDEISDNQSGPPNCGGVNGTAMAAANPAVPADNSLSIYAYDAGKNVNGAVSTNAWLTAERGTAVVSNSGPGSYDLFIAAAIGVISGDYLTQGASDIWTIDQNKELIHSRAGY